MSSAAVVIGALRVKVILASLRLPINATHSSVCFMWQLQQAVEKIGICIDIVRGPLHKHTLTVNRDKFESYLVTGKCFLISAHKALFGKDHCYLFL